MSNDPESGFPEISTVTVHVRSVQISVVSTLPTLTETVRPVSEQVPFTVYEDLLPLLITAGELIATVGIPVSFDTVVEAWVAAFPTASVWLAVTATDALSATAVTLSEADHAPAVQVGVPETAPTLTVTVLVFSEHVPLIG